MKMSEREKPPKLAQYFAVALVGRQG